MNTHLTPSYKVPKNSGRGKVLPTMAAIATGWVLQCPKILQLLKYLSYKDNFGMYTHVLNDTKHNEIDNSIFTHNSEGENQIWLLLYKAQIIIDIRM